ncbi:hypothetical protein BC831DRAFT_457747 [Entophlyctis helioformis]|nr:hypothetical protein BC831DRAFT_457747 [Entophlyctis helioformis]
MAMLGWSGLSWTYKKPQPHTKGRCCCGGATARDLWGSRSVEKRAEAEIAS